jgi:sphingomyelin phosphodiesterase acid-like 3
MLAWQHFFIFSGMSPQGVPAMFSHRLKTIYLLLLFTLLVLVPTRALAQSGTGQFLLISDIHFDPFYDGALFDQLDTQPVEMWAKILEKSQPAGFNLMGTDSNYALLKSSLDEAARRIPGPDFLLYPGDFLAHVWPGKYDRLARQSHLANPQSYRAFTSKAIRFLANEFRRRYPRTPILATLGNDDSYCGDYMLTPDGPFLKMFADTWGPLLAADVDRKDFQATFARGGHYAVRLPGTKNQRLIVLTSVFFSVTYDNACGDSGQTPALDQLRWLDTSLAEARAAGETAWLLMHIPPGINSFSTSESVRKGGPAITFWQQELTSRFLQLVRQYQPAIQAVFAGHTHMDDFRVITLDGKPVLFSKIAPAISPIYGNNPGFQIYQYDRATGTIQNYQTVYLTNLNDAGKSPGAAKGLWALEYDFHETYGFSVLNPATVAQLANRMSTDDAVQRQYMKFYSVSAGPEINAETVNVYRCAILNAAPAEFQMCYRGVLKPERPPPLSGRKIRVEPRSPR